MKKMNRIISIAISTTFVLITACEKSSNEPPKASFTVSSDIARVGDTIFFQNTSESANTFEWDFGDGNSSTEENPSHIYTELGSYIIHLKVANTDGSDEASKGLEITLWSARALMPTGRWLLNTCVVDGKIYAIGGGTKYGIGALGTLEVYDPVTDTWSAKSEMPTPRQEPASSVVDGKIYVIGGGEAPTNELYVGVEVYSTVEEYNPTTDTWTEKSPMPTARWTHSACAVDGRIYVIGGAGSDSYPTTADDNVTSVEMYDPATDTWTQVSSVPRPMILSSSAVIDGEIYVMGGDFEDFGQRVDKYDPKTNTWTRKADMLSTRSDFGCSVMNKKIYVIGGDQGYIDNIVDFLDIYDPAKDTWITGVPMTSKRAGLSSSMVDGKIYAIGGLTWWNLPGSKRVEVYYE